MLKTPSTLMGRIIRRMALTTLVATLCAYGWQWADFLATSEGLQNNVFLGIVHSLNERVDADSPEPALADVSILDAESGNVVFSASGRTTPPEGVFQESWRFSVGNRIFIARISHPGHSYGDVVEVIWADLFRDGGWLLAPFLVLFMGISALTVRSALKPLRKLSAMAEAIGPTSTDIRLPCTDVPREILPLVHAVNNALERLEEGFRLQRDFTADAAHELRTPLAVLTAHIDTLKDPAVAGPLRRDLAGMTHLVEQLLRVARVEALNVAPGEQADLGDIARDVAAYLAPMAIRSGRIVEVDAPETPVLVHGQTDALFHAVRNLVDNALRFTPTGTAVVLSVTAVPPMLSVRDHGPGIAPERRPDIFKRFWRSDRRTAGAGLGLAIVQRTMQAHGGAVLVEDAPQGGAQFRLVFPTP